MTMLPRRRRNQPGLPPVSPLPPSGIAAPLATATQDQLRERRHKRLRVHYRSTFNLAAEVAALCAPVAHEASRLPNPVALRDDIEAVADAVHEVLSAAVGMIAADREQSAETRTRTVQAAADLAVRPQAPAITEAAIVSGSWVTRLVAYCEPYSGDLAAMLGRALPPEDPRLRGDASASERVERALRVLDGAVGDLSRRIPKVAARQALPSLAEFNAGLKANIDVERRQRALAKLGVGSAAAV